MSRRGDDRAIGLRELNLDLNCDDFLVRFVVQSRALRAVVRLPAGILDKKRERRQETDGRNVRPGFGRRKQFRVFVQVGVHRFIAPLPEEIRFAHRLLRKRRVVTKRRRA